MAKRVQCRKSRALGAVSTVVLCLSLAALAKAQDQGTASFDIPAQSLSDALAAYSQQSKVMVFAPSAMTDGKVSNAVNGDMTPAQALEVLIGDAPLTYQTREDGSVLLKLVSEKEVGEQRTGPFRVVQVDQEDDRDVEVVSDDENKDDRDQLKRDEIIVTGTNIRGVAPDSAPIEVYTDVDIAKTGAVTVEQFIATLPQNLNNISTFATAATNNAGELGRNGINLRGLGVGTTLVLLNGRRLLSPGGSSPDTSLIPLGAVKRIEVLTDGASAVYGSDAIGGVVNIILKERVEGIDAGVTYGTVTDGDHEQFKADITAGTSWNSGSISGSYNLLDQSVLRASDRDFATASTPFFLLPEDTRHSGLITINQQFSDRLSVQLDALYSSRNVETVSTFRISAETDTFTFKQEQWFLNGGLTYEISDDFTFDAYITYTDFKEDNRLLAINIPDGSLDRDVDFVQRGDDVEIGGQIDGRLFDVPGGEIRFSVGGGYADESFRSATVRTPDIGRNNDETLDRSRYYVFGEVFVPIVSPEQGIAGINRFELNGALRFTDYSDFGSNTSPRIGLLWSPVEGLNLRGTYSEAFRAPGLNQLRSFLASYFLFPPAALGFPDPFSTDDSSVYLFAQGSNNPNIGPETSQSYTAGFDIDDLGIDGLRLSGTYFKVEYQDRLGEPDTSGGFAAVGNPALFPSLFNNNPSPEFIAELVNGSRNVANFTNADINDVNSIIAVTTVTLDNRIQNIARSQVEGIDFTVDYEQPTRWGKVNFGTNLTYLLESIIVPTEGAPVVNILNTPTNPMNIRFRSFLGLTNGGFSGQVSVNYYDSYTDPFQTPEVKIDSWTTVDLSLAYVFRDNSSKVLDGLTLSLAITNFFDQDPPLLSVANTTNVALNEPVGFDPANASPVGRFIQFGIRKKF